MNRFKRASVSATTTAAVMALAASLAACAAPAPAPAQPATSVPTIQTTEAPASASAAPAVVTIKAHDNRYEAPNQIEAGLVTLSLENAGTGPQHAQLLRLNDGATLEQFQAALQRGEEGTAQLMSMVTLPGGIGAVDPGGRQDVTLSLEPGAHFLVSFVPGPDGVPGVAKGLLAPITVKAPAAASVSAPAAAAPKTDLTIKMADFTFDMPAEMKAGKQVWAITNNGPQPHEIVFVKLAEGKTVEDAQTWMHQPAGPPPFSNTGGFNGIDSGKTGYLHLDLAPGNYVAICQIPDPASGKAHMELGMVKAFTVK